MEPLLLFDVDVHQLCYILYRLWRPLKLLKSWMNFNILIGAFTPNPVYLDGVVLFYSPLWLSLSPRELRPHTQ